MPNMNTFFHMQGIQARQRAYDLGEARKFLILLLFPLQGEFLLECARYFWSGYNNNGKVTDDDNS